MQLIAIITMLIDHIGVLFFPGEVMWRMIGRIAYPIYAYALVQGYTYTSSHRKYLSRLMIIAVVSQIPYQAAFNTNGLNVVASLFVALLLLRVLDALHSGFIATVLITVTCICMDLFPFEYGAYGLILVLIFRYAKYHQILIMHLLLNMAYLISYSWVIQFISIIPTFVIVYGGDIWKKIESWRLPGWVWRAFYPVHLTLLILISYIIRN